jgi:hypothetical protein
MGVPTCSGCCARDTRIAELETQLAEVQRRLAEVEARLRTTSSNSSLPPSANPLDAPKPPKKKKSKRKPGSLDTIATLTAPDATYDPIMKFRTESTPAVQFTLGVDNSDSDKFKIYSGDGLASGDEFVIDSNGVTTIANLNLGSTTFDENAGAVTWIDMSVTSAAAVDTIESYTAAIDGNSMLTVYAESDGAGSIQNKAINFFDGAAGSVSAKYLSNNFGTAMYGGAFIDANSYYGQEFGSDTTGSITADSATVVGDDGKWYFDTTDTAATYVQQDQINGYGTVGVTTTATDIAGGIFFGEAQNNLSLVFAKG